MEKELTVGTRVEHEKLYIMNIQELEKKIVDLMEEYCEDNGIEVKITKDTPLIGSNRIFDSLGLVNILVDIETMCLDEGLEISLVSESAMSARISPYRTVGALCNFIVNQIETSNNE